MNRRTIKIIIGAVVLIALIGAGVAIYFFTANSGPIVGHVKYGECYYLTEMRDTERFAGAQMNHASYFRIKNGGKTGELYLKGLTATTTGDVTAPIPLIITSYKEGPKQTVIEFEYIIGNGENTKIEHLTAISTDSEIRIKTVESHGVDVIEQKSNKIDSLDYAVTILVFKLDQEEA